MNANPLAERSNLSRTRVRSYRTAIGASGFSCLAQTRYSGSPPSPHRRMHSARHQDPGDLLHQERPPPSPPEPEITRGRECYLLRWAVAQSSPFLQGNLQRDPPLDEFRMPAQLSPPSGAAPGYCPFALGMPHSQPLAPDVLPCGFGSTLLPSRILPSSHGIPVVYRGQCVPSPRTTGRRPGDHRVALALTDDSCSSDTLVGVSPGQRAQDSVSFSAKKDGLPIVSTLDEVVRVRGNSETG